MGFVQLKHCSSFYAGSAWTMPPRKRDPVKKSMAIIHIAFIAIIIIYGTTSLYMGNFEGLYATFPLLVIYYIFVVARQKRVKTQQQDKVPDRDEIG